MADEFLDQNDAADFLKALASAKGVPALARYCRVDRSNLYKRLSSDKGLSPALCDALGIEKVVVYHLPGNLAEFWERHQDAAQSKDVNGSSD